MPHDVGGREHGEVNVLHALQNLAHHPQPAVGSRGEVHLSDVTRDDDLGPEPEPREEHLHLLGAGVLRFVEKDERVVERATAHVRQRGDLDGARAHQPRDRLRVEHVVQRVVERPQVRVDLLVERARQEPEALARLHRRAREDDAVDVLGLQRLHGLRHREVGLAGTRRADAEDDRVAVDRIHVALLVERLRADRAPAVGQDVERQDVHRPFRRVVAQHVQAAPHALAGEHVSAFEQRHELLEQMRHERVLRGLTGDGDLVAPDMDVRRKRRFDDRQQLVALAEKAHHVVRAGHDDLGHAEPRLSGPRGRARRRATGHCALRRGALRCHGL